jgi:two-component SAPR family response regulator
MAFEQVAHLESKHILVTAGIDARNLLAEISKDASMGTAAAELLERVETFERRIPALRRQLRPKTSTIPFAPPKLIIQSLGWAQVELDGKPVTVPEWQNQKRVREFFFYLLAHPHGLTKEEVGLVFWPDSSPAQLKLQFKNLIYRLRCGLGPEVVLFDEDRYWFNRELDYVYDVEALSAHLARARTAASPEEAIEAYKAVVDLYRGD